MKRILALTIIALALTGTARAVEPVESWVVVGTTTIKKVINRDVQIGTSSTNPGVVLRSTGTVEAKTVDATTIRVSALQNKTTTPFDIRVSSAANATTATTAVTATTAAYVTDTNIMRKDVDAASIRTATATIRTDLTAETTARMAADTLIGGTTAYLGTAIGSEASTRSAQILAVAVSTAATTTALNNEILSRTAQGNAVGIATATIRTDLSAETVARQAQDTTIAVSTAATTTALNNEISSRTALGNSVGISTASIRADLSTETTNRQNADIAIAVSTTATTVALNAEILTRNTSDAMEVSARTAADNAIKLSTGAIAAVVTAETSARQAGDYAIAQATAAIAQGMYASSGTWALRQTFNNGVVTNAFNYPLGAVAGAVFSCDSYGNGTWQDLLANLVVSSITANTVYPAAVQPGKYAIAVTTADVATRSLESPAIAVATTTLTAQLAAESVTRANTDNLLTVLISSAIAEHFYDITITTATTNRLIFSDGTQMTSTSPFTTSAGYGLSKSTSGVLAVTTISTGNVSGSWPPANIQAGSLPATVSVSSLNFTGAQLFNIIYPAGQYIEFASTIAPTGYNVLYCNGQSVSTTTYSTLFATIGYKYGGSTNTFKVPDRRGLFTRGFDDGRGEDADSAFRVFGSTQADTLQGHFHQSYFRDLGYNSAADLATNKLDAANYTTPLTAPGDGGTKAREAITDGTNDTPRKGKETRAKNINVCYFIKY